MKSSFFFIKKWGIFYLIFLFLISDRYKVFRYEDFSMQPYENSADVFKFFGFTMHNNVKQFLDTHTKSNIGGVSSTFRDTKTAPFKWREKLTRQEVFDIQSECAVAMELWGYR